MLDVFYSAKFKRDYKRAVKQGRNAEALLAVVDTLAREEPLAPQLKDHALLGDYIGHRECHIEPDWLLIYKIDHGELILTLTRTGSHGELFRK